MNILGLGGSNHDFSSCIVKDGQVVCMVEDERITRKKHGVGLGIELAKGYSIKQCCKIANMSMDDFDLIIGNDILNPIMYRRLNKEVKLINHHLAHAASSFYTSSFKDAAILVVDSVGSKEQVNHREEYETISFARGCDTQIEILDKNTGENLKGTDYIENSIGIFYSIITDIIGFGEHQEGKTMGLAPYGTDKYYALLKQHVKYKGEGRVEITKQDIEELLSYRQIIERTNERDKFEVQADFAWAAQTIIEECLTELCQYLKKLTAQKNLCLAGGLALNSVANYKLYKSKIFEKIYIVPACGDNGTSIGSALYGYYHLISNNN